MKATLLAIDREKDLALWKLPVDHVSELAELPREEPAGPMTAIGHPGGVAEPKLKRLKFVDQFWVSDSPQGLMTRDDSNGSRIVWDCKLTEGEFGGGDSGGGVFLGGQLAGVITNGGPHCTGTGCETRVYCTTWQQVRAFVDQHHERWADCEGRTTLAGKALPTKPSDALYDGKGPRPCDLCSDKAMAAEIDKLRREVAELKSRLEKDSTPDLDAAITKWVHDHGQQWLDDHKADIKGPAGANGAPGPKGDRGDAGEPGAAGQAGAPGRITVILVDAAGKEVSRASDVESGSVVRLNVKRFQR